MIQHEFFVQSQVDRLGLSVLTGVPEDGEIRAVVQLVHGMAEMKERYIPFMEYLTSLGYSCIIHDHRGHGKSVTSKADLGYMYGTGGRALVEDAYTVTKKAKALWPGKKLILFGHSMGSLVVRCYTKKYDSELSALIVMGSPAKNGALPAAKFLNGVIGTFRGKHHVSGLINKLAFSSYLKNIPNPRTEFDWLSVNENNVDAYIASEYCGFPFTCDGFRGLFDAMGDTYDESGWSVSNPSLPILFVSGSEDPCIGSKENFEFAQNFMEKRGYSDVTGILYEGLRHEILNEDEHDAVYADIAEWLSYQV